MTQLAQAAPAQTARTAEIAALNDAARAGSLVTSKTVFTRALADILAGEDPDPRTRQFNLMLGQRSMRRLINETPIDPGNDPHGERDLCHHRNQGWTESVSARRGQSDRRPPPTQRRCLTRAGRIRKRRLPAASA